LPESFTVSLDARVKDCGVILERLDPCQCGLGCGVGVLCHGVCLRCVCVVGSTESSAWAAPLDCEGAREIQTGVRFNPVVVSTIPAGDDSVKGDYRQMGNTYSPMGLGPTRFHETMETGRIDLRRKDAQMLGWIWRILVWFLVAKFAAWIALAAVVFGGGALMGAVPSLEVPISVAVIVSWPGTLPPVSALLAYRHVASRERARRQVARVSSAHTHSGGQAGAHGSR